MTIFETRPFQAKSFLLGVFFTLASTLTFCQEVTIVYQKGTSLFENTALSLKASLSTDAFIPVEKDKEESAKTELSTKKDSIVCAIGPQAISAAFQSGSTRGVAVGLPNPFSKNISTKKDFAFVALYPESKLVFEYLSRTLGARTIGVLYTSIVNQEMAEHFKNSAGSSGCSCKLLGVENAQALTAPFPGFLKQVDVVILLIDPIAYNKDAMKFIVTKALDSKTPIVGFTEQTASSGIPLALFVPSKELSKTIMKAIQEKKSGLSGSQCYFSDDFKLSVNMEAIKVMGMKYDETKVVQIF